MIRVEKFISQNVPCDAYRVLTRELQDCDETPRWKPYQRSVPRRTPTHPPKQTPPPPKTNPSTPRPLHPFLEIFSGRNCAVLKQIYFNTRHNIWTNKKKKVRTFLYSFIKEQKKKNKTEHWGFLLFASSAFWLLACNVRCIILPWGGDDTFRWKLKCLLAVEVEVFSLSLIRGLSSG